jgi:ferredoxin--NADP+ reductase
VSPSRQPGIRARLETRRDVAEGLAVFRIHLDADFTFMPGQYATLWLTHGGRTIPRPYSIASAPSSPRTLEFYINLVEHGRLTPSLWEPEVVRALAAGTPETTLVVTGPHGRMVLESEERRDLVLVASGTGLSPFLSMIRSEEERFQAAPDRYEHRRIYVIHGVSYSANLGYRGELEALANQTLADPARKLGLVYLPTISRPQMDRLWRGLTGRAETIFEGRGAYDAPRPLDLEVRATIRAMLRPDRHAVYVCGHPGTIDNTVRILSTLGFRPRIDLKCEKYYA